MSRDHILRFLDTTDPFFPSIDDHPFLTSSSCPLGFTASSSPIDTFHLDLLPSIDDPFLLLDHRVSALELCAPPPPRSRRKYTYAAEADGRKVKWTAEYKPSGVRNLRWEAQIDTPFEDGFDRKWKWEESKTSAAAGNTTKVKWAKEIEGKGCLHPWSHAYSVEEEHNTAGCVAIKKALECKGKRKDFTPQDAALLIQMNYRAHLAHRSQVLRCLRHLAVAKAKLKDISSLFYSVSYRRRLAHDSEERQRFADEIMALLLTVDALEGPADYVVRNAKRSMHDQLEGMQEEMRND